MALTRQELSQAIFLDWEGGEVPRLYIKEEYSVLPRGVPRFSAIHPRCAGS